MPQMKVIMLGTGSPWPDLERRGPSQVLLIDDLPILIDCGRGAMEQLMRAGIAPETVDHIWLTHLHADHIYTYGEMLMGRWFRSRKQLTVYGPPGTKKLHELTLEIFKEDIEYKLGLGRPGDGLLDTKVIEIEEPGDIPSDLPAKVTAARMVHNVITYAFRFQIGEQAVVFSGDTAPTDALVELSEGAQVLVMDCCLAPNAVYSGTNSPERQRIWVELQKEHCTPEQCADTANRAGVKTLVLTHFLPNTDAKLAEEQASQGYDGTVIAGEDLLTIVV